MSHSTDLKLRHCLVFNRRVADVFRRATTSRNELSCPERGMADCCFSRKMHAMKNGGNNNDDRDQRPDLKPRWRPGKSLQRDGATQSDQRSHNNFGQRVHPQHNPGNANDNRREQRRRHNTVPLAGQHDSQPTSNNRRGRDMPAWTVDVHRPKQRPAGQKHQLEGKRRKKRHRHHDQPRQRAAPPALHGECHSNRQDQRKNDRLVSEISKIFHADRYTPEDVNKRFRTTSYRKRNRRHCHPPCHTGDRFVRKASMPSLKSPLV